MASPLSEPVVAQPMLHPIQRLPADLLAEIFVHCIPGTPIGNDWLRSLDWHPYLMSNRTAPLLLCRVCSSWRSLAISEARLWQIFAFHLIVSSGRPHEVKFEGLYNGIHNWLKRSGTLPLIIRFALGYESTSNSTQLFPSKASGLIMDIAHGTFSEFSSRWGYVSVQRWRRSTCWRPSILGDVPNLHNFDGTSFLICNIPFTFAPNLRGLSLYMLPLNFMASVSSIPWGRLEELFVDLPVPISVFLELFRCCPLLEGLDISAINDGRESSSLLLVPRLTHNALRRLSVNTSRASRVAVDHLTLPGLKVLRLDGMRIILNKPYSVLNLFTRSKCALHKLSLMWSGFKPHHLLKCLQHPSCQTLMSLTIEDDDCGQDHWMPIIDNQVLSRLTLSEKQDTAPLCPGLAEIQFTRCYRSEVNSLATALGRMVHSRCFGQTSDHRLRSLDIVTYYPISQEDDESLQLARNEGGLKLSYAFGSEDIDEPPRFIDDSEPSSDEAD